MTLSCSYMRELSKYVRVHSYGTCDHNMDLPLDHGYDSRAKLDLLGSCVILFFPPLPHVTPLQVPLLLRLRKH